MHSPATTAVADAKPNSLGSSLWALAAAVMVSLVDNVALTT